MYKIIHQLLKNIREKKLKIEALNSIAAASEQVDEGKFVETTYKEEELEDKKT